MPRDGVHFDGRHSKVNHQVVDETFGVVLRLETTTNEVTFSSTTGSWNSTTGHAYSLPRWTSTCVDPSFVAITISGFLNQDPRQ